MLPRQTYREFIAAGRIASDVPFVDNQIQPASIDLRLGPVAYRVQASFLPGAQAPVRRKIDALKMHEIDLTGGAVLERGCVYIVPLLERLSLPADIGGTANPKSTTGRLDIFTRLIPDYASEFERVRKGYKGPLYLEVSPRTFSVFVRQGLALNQLRLRRGDPPPSDAALADLNRSEGLVYSADEKQEEAVIRKGLWVSIDLDTADAGDLIGYRAKRHAPLVDATKINHYDPLDFWEPIARNKSRSLILEPDEFYILVSKEKVRVPPTHAAEMVAYDSSVGEFRIHYAGFFDPGFGYGTNDIQGTRAVLEVRSHEVPFLLDDGQIVGRLIYERLTETPDRIYGVDIGSSYQRQGLALSKQFRRG
ncbi:MAG: 2'-deoxycytidine 5'-triphosphate deaminase [Rhodospirillales bacterium]|nr:2'-deoxycytidine 5'-triphosphate deaminase [Rhodospirillales bacterium]